MGIGAYRHRVTLQTTGGDPLVPAAWYCAVQSQGMMAGEGLAAFVVRGAFHPEITLETQIHHDGRLLQVQGINDVDDRHVELVLSAVEVRGRA
jgi:hypothetical protein